MAYVTIAIYDMCNQIATTGDAISMPTTQLRQYCDIRKNGIFILKIISKYKPVYSQSTNPCKAILLEYIPTF